MIMIPIHCDTYYKHEWFVWLIQHLGHARDGTWGIIINPDATAEHYADVFIRDPEDAILFRLSTGI